MPDERALPMSSLFAMLDEHEADARSAAEELRGQVTKLTEQLAAVEDELSRLAITRATALSVGYTEPEEPAPTRRSASPPTWPSSPNSNAHPAACVPDSCARSST